MKYLARFVKPEGRLGIAGAGLVREIDSAVPDHLAEWWCQDLWSLHSAEWWRWHWERTGIVSIEVADTMPDGWQLWLDWHTLIADNEVEITAVTEDRGRYLGYNRVVGRWRSETELADEIISLPAQYTKKPLLRGNEPGVT